MRRRPCWRGWGRRQYGATGTGVVVEEGGLGLGERWVCVRGEMA